MNWFSTPEACTKTDGSKAGTKPWKSPDLTIEDIKGLVNLIASCTRRGACDVEQFKQISPAYKKLCDSVKQHPDNFVIIKDIYNPEPLLDLPTVMPNVDDDDANQKSPRSPKQIRRKKKKKRR